MSPDGHLRLFGLFDNWTPKAGYGTLYYQGWNLFDQFHVSPGMLDREGYVINLRPGDPIASSVIAQVVAALQQENPHTCPAQCVLRDDLSLFINIHYSLTVHDQRYRILLR